MNRIVTPFRVGLLVLAALAAFIGFYAYVHKGGLSQKNSLSFYALFHDATGIEKKTPIEIAGIPVGEVEGVSLYQGEYARLAVRIKKSVPVHADAALTKRSASLLGEYVLELYPGKEGAPLLPDGGRIPNVYDEQGVQQVFRALGKTTEDIREVTRELKDMLAGETGSIQGIVGNIADLTESLNEVVANNGEQLQETLANFQRLSAQIAQITAAQQGSVGQIVENVRVASEEARDALATLDQILGANKGQLAENFQGLRETLHHLDESIRNVETITKKVAGGQGTLGRLVNDDALADRIDQAANSVSDFVNKITGIQTEVSLQDDYLFGEQAAKGYLNLKLIPKPDKYYLLQLVDDSRGTPSFTYNTNSSPTALQPATQEITSTSRSFKFSAEFAKRYGPATFRLGMIESTAGGGMDVDFFERQLSFTADLFDFDDYFQPYPRLRTYLTWRFLDHFEVRGGADDIINCQGASGFAWNCAVRNTVAPLSRGYTLGGRELFLGGGFYFTDDDLKSVFVAAPPVKP